MFVLLSNIFILWQMNVIWVDHLRHVKFVKFNTNFLTMYLFAHIFSHKWFAKFLSHSVICFLFCILALLKQSHLNQALLSIAEGTSGWFRIYPVYSYHSLSLSFFFFIFLYSRCAIGNRKHGMIRCWELGAWQEAIGHLGARDRPVTVF